MLQRSAKIRTLDADKPRDGILVVLDDAVEQMWRSHYRFPFTAPTPTCRQRSPRRRAPTFLTPTTPDRSRVRRHLPPLPPLPGHVSAASNVAGRIPEPVAKRSHFLWLNVMLDAELQF